MSKPTVSFNEELDYDNKRLVYVNDITTLDTHSYEIDNTLSTDEVVSTFDGGYQLGLIEQIEFYERNSEDNYKNLLEILNKLEEKNFIKGFKDDEITPIINSLKNLMEEHHFEVRNNLVKKFETSRFSNEKRIRDRNITERMYNFYDHLLRIHRTSL
jgi:hypothetical protein